MKPRNYRMEREANIWKNESHEEFNRRTLDKIAVARANRNLLRDVTNLAVVESRYDEDGELAYIPKPRSDAARITCPICNSKDFLVESFAHPKILVCERPNCIYARAVQKRNKIVRETEEEPLLKVVK